MVDLGRTPLANSFLREDDLHRSEPTFPLRAVVCEECWLVQLTDVVDPHAIFEDYAYFSSVSQTWLQHADRYAATMTQHLELGRDSLVLEVASNDGYLLKSFQRLGIRVLGIEPARNVAAAAVSLGIPTITEFLSQDLAEGLVSDGVKPQLIVANNVLAHVPDIRDFVSALRALMTPTTLLTVEFPHLLNLLTQGQFDTIYHEHYSYLSLSAANRLFNESGLSIIDVEMLPTHGGSLRIHAMRADARASISKSVQSVLAVELQAGLLSGSAYQQFSEKTERSKMAFSHFLESAHSDGRSVAAYGAAAKGNTLLNACRITGTRIEYVVDRSPHKQGLYLPGSRLPILSPSTVDVRRPDYLVVLPWNLAQEIIHQMASIRDWGGRFVLPIPSVQVIK